MSWFTRWFGKRSRAAKVSRRPSMARLQVERLERREVPTVSYYGGNLLPHVEAQALFLGNGWTSSAALTTQAATLNTSLIDITSGAYMDALTRAGYGVGRGTAAPGYLDNLALAPGSTISDAAIQAEVRADGHWIGE